MAGITFPISLLCTVKGEFGPLGQMDQEVERLSMRIRLTGRDMMRLGSAIEGFFTRLKGAIFNVLQGSLDWQAGLEDIQWALEDIGSVIGDALAPILEVIANILESVAQVLEDNPWMAYAVGVLLIIALLGMLLGKVMSLVGMLNIWFGVLLRVKSAHIGLGASIKGVFKYITGGKEGLEEYILTLTGTKKAAQATLPAMTAQTQAVGAQVSLWDRLKGGLGGVTGRLTNFISGTEDSTKSTQVALTAWMGGATGLQQQGKAADKTQAKMKKLGKNTKGAVTPLAGLGLITGIFGIFVSLIFAAEPIMELFGSIVEAISPALEVLTDALEPIIDYIADWIEANPALAAGIIAAIAAVLILVSQAGNITAFFGGIMSFLKGAPAMMPTLKTNIVQIAEAIFILAGAISVLVLSLGTAIWILSQTRFTLPEIIQLLWNLVAVVIVLGAAFLVMAGIMMAAGITLTPLSVILLPLAALLIAIGVAVLLVGAGFMLMGLGVQFAAQGILSLVNYIPQVAILVPLLFVLAAGFGLLAITATAAILPLIGLSIAFFALSASIFALAGAFKFLQAIGLGGIAQTIATGITLALIPRMQEGGTVIGEGMAILHPEEEVVPAKVTKTRAAEVPSTINVNFYGPVTSKEFVEREVVPVVKKAVEDELRRA